MHMDAIDTVPRTDKFYVSLDDLVRRNVAEVIRNNRRPLIIAGNGPSLRGIDYTRLPENALVMRINNFYFEEKYFLGKHVDYVFLAGQNTVAADSVHTLLNVLLKKEYTADYYFGRTDNLFEINKNYLPIIDVKNALRANKTISDYMALRHMPPGHLPTSGMMALFSAIGLGFHDIYLAGVDLYTGAEPYAFRVGVNHARLVGLTPGSSGYVNGYHSYDIDLQALLLAKGIEGVSIRTLCPESFSAEFLDVAPVVNVEAEGPLDKPDGYIADFIPIKKPAAPAPAPPPKKPAPPHASPAPNKTPAPAATVPAKVVAKAPTFNDRLQKYGPVKKTVVRYGDLLLPPVLAKPIDRMLKRMGIL